MPELLALVLYLTLRAAVYGIIALIAVTWVVGMLVLYGPGSRLKRDFR